MSTATLTERATDRTVVLLRPSEKKRLTLRASRANISNGELIRNLINAEERLSVDEEKVMEAALKMISEALAEARISLEKTNARLDRLHRSLKKRDLA